MIMEKVTTTERCMCHCQKEQKVRQVFIARTSFSCGTQKVGGGAITIITTTSTSPRVVQWRWWCLESWQSQSQLSAPLHGWLSKSHQVQVWKKSLWGHKTNKPLPEWCINQPHNRLQLKLYLALLNGQWSALRHSLSFFLPVCAAFFSAASSQSADPIRSNLILSEQTDRPRHTSAEQTVVYKWSNK